MSLDYDYDKQEDNGNFYFEGEKTVLSLMERNNIVYWPNFPTSIQITRHVLTRGQCQLRFSKISTITGHLGVKRLTFFLKKVSSLKQPRGKV